MNELDQILADSAPRVSGDGPATRRTIHEMSMSAASAARPRQREGSARGRRVTTAVIAASLGLAGIGVAAASTSGWWGGQGSPELVVQGALTEGCLDGFLVTADGAETTSVLAARAALRGLQVADLDLVATEASLRSTGLITDADPEGERAHEVLSTAIREHITAELAEQGLDGVEDWGLLGHSECTGDGQ
ncbi:MAG: hypothetical protein GX593_02405 [Actinomycetales bacterium]|nr:hypothetical protein [Actinomycetales bacterium]